MQYFTSAMKKANGGLIVVRPQSFDSWLETERFINNLMKQGYFINIEEA